MRQSAGTPLTLRPSLGTLRLSALADALRHLFPSDRIAGLLDPECGLTAEEVEERRHRYGSNGYPRGRTRRLGRYPRRHGAGPDGLVPRHDRAALRLAWRLCRSQRSRARAGADRGMDAYLYRRTQATRSWPDVWRLCSACCAKARRTTFPRSNWFPAISSSLVRTALFPGDGVLVSGLDLQNTRSLTGHCTSALGH